MQSAETAVQEFLEATDHDEPNEVVMTYRNTQAIDCLRRTRQGLVRTAIDGHTF